MLARVSIINAFVTAFFAISNVVTAYPVPDYAGVVKDVTQSLDEKLFLDALTVASRDDNLLFYGADLDNIKQVLMPRLLELLDSYEQTDEVKLLASRVIGRITRTNMLSPNKVLPNKSAVQSVVKLIKSSSNESIRAMGWKILSHIMGERTFSEEAMNQGLILEMMQALENADSLTDEEERYIVFTLGSLVHNGYYWKEDPEFLKEQILPALVKRIGHKDLSLAETAARTLNRITRYNSPEISKHLIEHGGAFRVIEQIGKCNCLGLDGYLLNVVQSIAHHLPEQKTELVKFNIFPRMNESLLKQRGHAGKNDVLAQSLSIILNLIVDNREAVDLLIEQGLPKFLRVSLEGCNNFKVTEQAVSVLSEIVKLNLPEQMGAFAEQNIQKSLEAIVSEEESSQYANNGEFVNKIKGILSSLGQNQS